MKLSNPLALEQRTRSRAYVGACDGASSVIIQRRTHALIEKLESGLQAAVSWASLLCVYMYMVAMAISELYAKYFFAIEFPIGSYIPSVIFGGARPPNAYIGGRLPPLPSLLRRPWF